MSTIQTIHTLSCRGFPPDTASFICQKAQTWPQFNRHTQDTTDEFNLILKIQRMSLTSFPVPLLIAELAFKDIWECSQITSLILWVKSG